MIGEGNVSFRRLGGYDQAINDLNETPGVPGFMHAEYSPYSGKNGVVERKYFTEQNAARLDAMRRLIQDWSDNAAISWVEEQLLLADLISAANSVANISGTYGCFLKHWTPGSLRPIVIKPRRLPRRATDLEASNLDVFDLRTTDADVVYFDPPYTKRQYSAYYHVLETIHAGDRPVVAGVTGLRPWQSKASVFSYKSKALDAIGDLARQTRARRVLLSYSNEGHVPRELLVSSLAAAGTVGVYEIQSIGRYRPNAESSANGDVVQEYVFDLEPFEGERSGIASVTSLVASS